MLGITVIAYFGSGDFNKFVSFIGSFCCVPLSFILPPLFHLKAVANTTFEKVVDIAFIVFGVVVMISVSVINIIEWGN
jgi:proton-coupled amino acid transporter